jgi:Ca2+/H+ antiporter, TMEM165/GDT1 family
VSSTPLPQTPTAIESSTPPILETVAKPKPGGFWKECLTAFITIFLAELGDKTQLSTLLITAESNSPWVVFCGAASALLATSFLGVVIGRWLAKRLSEEVLKTATGTSLLAISVWMLWDILQLHG